MMRFTHLSFWQLYQYLGADAGAVSNSVGKGKLQFNYIRDRILIEEVRGMDSGEGTSSTSALNLKNKGRSIEKNSN